MKRPLTDEDLLERASIDGRVAFATAAFAVGSGLVALLDRVGVPERIVGVLGPVLAVAGLALIGILLHAVRVSRFYAAGRAVPAPYAGLALVALTVGFVLPFLPPVQGEAPLRSLALGLAGGFIVAALVTGPLLRKTGAFSLPDLLAARFPNMGVRLGAVAVVAGVSLAVAAAGFEGAVRTFEVALGTGRGVAAVIVGLVILLMVIPGGMSGVVWGATGAAGILIASLALPLVMTMVGGEALPSPVLGDAAAWADAARLIDLWHGKGRDGAGGWALTIAVALGMGAMAPLLSAAVTANDTSAARKAGVSSLAWSALVMAIISISLAVAALVATQWLSGERPDRLPLFAYRASAADLLQICGKPVATPQAALAVCKDLTGMAGLILREQDYSPSGLWLVLAMPELREYGVAFSGLTGAGLIAIALVLAGAGFQSFGTALGHDALYRVRESHALTSRRLAMTRIILATAVMGVATLLSQQPVDPRKLIGVAIVLSASAIAPLLALALWPRASGTDAAIALLSGLCTAGVVIAVVGGAQDAQTLAYAAVIASAVAFAVGIATSFLHSGGIATEGSVFVHSVLHGETDVLHRDKGA